MRTFTTEVTYFTHRDMRNSNNESIFDVALLYPEAKLAYELSSICIYQLLNGNCIVVKSRY